MKKRDGPLKSGDSIENALGSLVPKSREPAKDEDEQAAEETDGESAKPEAEQKEPTLTGFDDEDEGDDWSGGTILGVGPADSDEEEAAADATPATDQPADDKDDHAASPLEQQLADLADRKR